MLRSLLKGSLGLALLAAAFGAQATPVIGTSSGSFAGLSDCDSLVPNQSCRITNGGTQVEWGSQSSSSDFVNPSKLKSLNVDINSNTGANGVKIAQLDWYNSATITTSDLDDLKVAWTLTLQFTAPSGPDANGSEVFNLTINNPVNPSGDLVYGLLVADLNNINNSLDLSGVSMTNLRYAVADGSGSGTTTFNNNVWYNDENNWASLYILADFRSRGTTSVVEPGSLALLCLGLVAVAAATRRRRARG